MKILFIHQNFPAQFAQLAQHLIEQSGNELLALMQPPGRSFEGVGVVPYRFQHGTQSGIHPLLGEMEAKVLRGEAVADAAQRLKSKGWLPDVIIGHPGWGELLFIRDIFPDAKLVAYCEYYYRATGQDFNFDIEFKDDSQETLQRMKLKNTVMLNALAEADAAYAPTELQIANKGVTLRVGGEVITYAARSLEPVRGFHQFMRSLPAVLEKRPNAHVVIMGAAEASYGSEPNDFKNWQDKMLAEVGHLLDPQRVHFTGFLPKEQYLAALQISKVHVYLTYPFLLSWSMLEAMACGALVIGSDTAPVTEILKTGKNGLTVPFFDTAKLAQTLVAQLKSTSEKNQTIRRAARNSIERDFSRTDCVNNLLKLMEC